MLLRKCLLVLWLMVLSGPAGIRADNRISFADPPQGTFLEDWYAVELGGQKCGHMHSTLSRSGDVITSTEDMVITIQRAGITIQMTISKKNRETVAGKPLSVQTITKMAMVAMKYEAEIDGDKVTLKTMQFGTPQTSTYHIPQTYKLVWGALLEQRRRGLEPDTTYSIDTYDPSLSASTVIRTQITIGSRRPVDLYGRKTEAIWSEAKTSFGAMTLTSNAYLDDNGMALKMLMPLPGTGMQIALTRCPKAFALRKGTAPEMFLSSLIPVERKVSRVGLQSGTYRLSLKGSGRGKIPALPNTDMQTVHVGEDKTQIVTVKRSDHKALAKGPFGPPTAEDAEYLKSSFFLNHSDEVIRKMAAEARGDAKKPYALADRLRRYVSRIIETKALNVGFATASEVARSREGDCSEHAVLLAALGRACGIPSRVVSGIIYVDQFRTRRQVFGFHMWTQFKIGGKWVDFDAAQDQTDCDPTHIALDITSLKDEGFADVSMALLGLIGRLKIEVLETTP